MEKRVLAVKALPDYHLEVHFYDEDVRYFDVRHYIRGPWYGMLKNPEYFAKVKPMGETVVWEDGQDIAPHELYECSQPCLKRRACDA